MKKVLCIIFVTVFCLSSLIANASSIDIANVDKVVIKYELDDGTIKESEQINRKVGKFEDAIINVLDYLANTKNVKDIISINDIPIEETQFEKYGKPLENKGAGYSNSKDIIEKDSHNKNVNISTDIPDTESPGDVPSKNSGSIKNVKTLNINKVTYVPISGLLKDIGFSVIEDFNSYYQYLSAKKDDSCIEIKSSEKFVLLDTKKVIIGNSSIYNTSYSDIYVSITDAEAITGYTLTYNSKDNSIHYEKESSTGGDK